MNINQLMYDAFQYCMVQDGKIYFSPGTSFSREEFMAIYNKFMEDLLDYNIPHNRVVGIRFAELAYTKSVITSQPAYGCSYIHLLMESSKIIPMNIEGNNPVDDICFVCDNEQVPNLEDSRHLEPVRILNSKIFSTEECGQLVFKDFSYNEEFDRSPAGMFDSSNDFVKPNLEINVNTLTVMGLSLRDVKRPRCLIPDYHISSLKNDAFRNTYGSETYFFYKKGTGIVDNRTNGRLFTRDSGVVPCRTKYDLSEFILCRYPMPNGLTDGLDLSYKIDIDEGVLEHILREYGKGKVVSDGN